MLAFRVLGPLSIRVDDADVSLASVRQRRLLAALLLRVGRPVGMATLVEAAWSDRPPRSAVNSAQSHISRLRRLLGPEALVWTGSGYVLRVAATAVDAYRFESLIDQARSATEPGTVLDLLDGALALWNDEAYPDLAHSEPAVAEGVRLAELHLTGRELRAEALLAAGRGDEAVASLRALTLEHPLRERPWQAMMVALHRTGRQADALSAFLRYEKLLAAHGLEPGSSVRELRTAILATPDIVREPGGAVVRGVPRPAQLPALTAAFTGRHRHLEQLNLLLANGPSSAAVIATVAGTAGVGKTALVIRWAHSVADEFPDGQLYVNLRGFDPNGTATEPAEAIRGFLDAFDVLPDRIPPSTDAQAALYRRLLTGKRILVVLDNARDAEQVRPLLPGATGCLVVVTSRNQLTGLVATEGAHPLTLDLPTRAEARDMLISRISVDRATADPDAVDEIIARCARLPLALAVVAARAATHPDFPLATLAAELREARGGLDALAGGDAATDVRAVFSWSYRTLNPDAARLFRLLGLHPGPDLGTAAAASLAGRPKARVRLLLGELSRAHLVTEHTPGRYLCHDLLRSYTTEQAHVHDTETDRRAALLRILDHYLHTAHTAAMLIDPNRDPLDLTPTQPGVTPEDLADADRAMAWFTAEHQVLLAVIEQAAEARFDTHTWQLASTVWTFFDRRGHWHDWAATQRAALDAARRLDDRPGQALAHRHLASAYGRLGRYDDAHTDYRAALALYGELRDLGGQARTHVNIAWVLERQGRDAEALGHAEQAIELHRDTGDRAAQARALSAIGYLHARLGDHERSMTCSEQALALFQEVGDRYGQAATWDGLGYAHHQLDHYPQAVECYRHAVDLLRDLGDRYNEAGTLTRLGDTHQADGEPDRARDAWRLALDILDRLGHADAEQLRTKLSAPAE